ncbi:MAG: hypothetical protein HY646_06435 [Acidobacteria bacterium]|nr:hypothetical protein [Acidobacteriota bacterium]
MNAGILVFLLAAAPLQSAEDVYRKDYTEATEIRALTYPIQQAERCLTFITLGYLFLLVLLEILLRKRALAIVAVLLILDGPSLASPQVWVSMPMNLLIDGALLFVLFRYGWLSSLVSHLVIPVFMYPMTFDTTAWYSSAGYVYLAVVAAITLYGFRTSLGGRPLVNLPGFELLHP